MSLDESNVAVIVFVLPFLLSVHFLKMLIPVIVLKIVKYFLVIKCKVVLKRLGMVTM